MRTDLSTGLALAATALAGLFMAFQSRANGTLAEVVGTGIHAATLSFAGGMVVMVIALALVPAGRRGFRALAAALRSGELRWWMLTGGLGGVSVVVAQAFTVPLIGVSVFTMAFVAGQLAGALVVDSTELPPGGRTPATPARLLGTLVVMTGVVVASWGGTAGAFPLWAPLVPFASGALTTVQQALNGRVKRTTASAVTATTVNFAVGGTFLLACSALAWAAGAPPAEFPALPGESWMLVGGLVGVLFIGITTTTVQRLGVLLLSLTSLFGNLLGSLVLDLVFPGSPPVTPGTLVGMAIVLAGVTLASWPKGAE
ncbi:MULTISPECIES: DMT family transporter [Brevibacterium]|uniref:Transporter family-2 protein n=1 Tax=Brevibacterium salitolerans TaxID=1403566 RepID=A0ABN2WG83_9MICO|nr:DMT family transporter [Brevibacterium sp.]